MEPNELKKPTLLRSTNSHEKHDIHIWKMGFSWAVEMEKQDSQTNIIKNINNINNIKDKTKQKRQKT